MNAAFEQNAGFGFALGDDIEDAWLLDEEIEDGNRLLGRGKEIDVADDLAMTAQTAR